MKRVLIANRGEIALRILRACRELGLETVAAYSQADNLALHLPLADDTVCIGKHSYLDASQILSAALSRNCDGVHPGYGFLSESSDFALQVQQAGLCFIGPAAAHIELMGDKAKARAAMAASGIPVLPGSDGEVTRLDDAIECAKSIGFPVMVKASHGGGGRGIQIVSDEGSLRSVFEGLRNQAEQLFGNSGVYIEKWLDAPRHIEIQVFGNGNGRVIHFGARECSIQRRHQKLLEETPPPGIPSDQISALATSCCNVLAELKYSNAGTLEFLFQDGAFHFIEMNTRIQVEHPITESVTGIDLVKLQLSFASSGSLSLEQSDISFSGHAMECRINAEDRNYQPAPGPVNQYHTPGGPGIRLDSHLYPGYVVPHYYDSLLAKLISTGSDRAECIARMERALAEFVIRPLSTNIELQRLILRDLRFRSGELDTHFLEGMEK
ncbi:MAG: acetyl-CoA carboxylase biotin carboxylase subunit [Candidatus Azotimanducaceae bacterium WSBS_2022_MAG_OTU7]